MLLQVCRECRNFFVRSEESGKYEIQDGKMAVKREYVAGRYIAITGSVFNDDIKQIASVDGNLLSFVGEKTQDEGLFEGRIYELAFPRDFLDLVDEITEFVNSGEGRNSNIVSETVQGIHSYKVATGNDGAPLTWQKLFAHRLAHHRTNMFYDIDI